MKVIPIEILFLLGLHYQWMDSALDELSDGSLHDEAPVALLHVEADLDALTDGASGVSMLTHSFMSVQDGDVANVGELEDALDSLEDGLDGNVNEDMPLALVGLHPVLHLAHSSRCVADEELDNDIMLAAIVAMDSSNTRTTDTSTSANASLSRTCVTDIREQTCAVSYQLDNALWSSMMDRLAASSQTNGTWPKLHVNLEIRSYDGIDMKLRTQCSHNLVDFAASALALSTGSLPPALGFGAEALFDDGGSGPSGSGGIGASDPDQPPTRLESSTLGFKANSKVKVFHTDAFRVAAVEYPHGLAITVSSLHVPLQRSDRTTSQAHLGLLNQQAPMPAGARSFSRRGRVANTGRYGPNYAAELEFVHTNPDTQLFGVHFPCQAHMGATCLTDCEKGYHGLVAGTLSYARSVKSDTEMGYIRLAFGTAIWEGLEPGVVDLDDGAVAYKKLVLKVCTTPDDYYTHNILAKFAPWDWRSEKLVFPSPPGTSKKDIHLLFLCHLLPVFVARQPHLYDRKKWVGWEQARRDTVLPWAVSNLLGKAHDIYIYI